VQRIISWTFIALAVCSTLILPCINLLAGGVSVSDLLSKPELLFRADVVATQVSNKISPYGFSIDPGQAIIGYDDWLFLGNDYSATLATKRRPLANRDIQQNRKLIRLLLDIKSELSRSGIRGFKIIVGHDKNSIYPEFLPRWVSPVDMNAIDDLFSRDGGRVFVDTRSNLRKQKLEQPYLLYYREGTHWNLLGASLAFRNFVEAVSPELNEVHWPAESKYEVVGADASDSDIGLTRFLRLTPKGQDQYAHLAIENDESVTTLSNAETYEPVEMKAPKQVDTESSGPILLARTSGALNEKRVLIVTDSFGKALSPFFVTTFSEVIFVHRGQALKNLHNFGRLIEKWKPDHVFLVFVERDIRGTLLYLDRGG